MQKEVYLKDLYMFVACKMKYCRVSGNFKNVHLKSWIISRKSLLQ